MRIVFAFCLTIRSLTSGAQLSAVSSADSVLLHQLQRDKSGGTLAWYKPEVPGAAYAHINQLASDFLLNTCPIDATTGLPLYLVTCCFNKPTLTGSKYVGEEWPHNPACFYAGSVQSFAISQYTFTGDARLIELVRTMLDHQLEYGTTPAGWKWENVPYASADPFVKEYQGATRWEAEGFRGDGLHVIEPDKVGELGYGYLRFYQVTSDPKYLEAAMDCAKALAKHVRTMPVENSPFIEARTQKSPWPFRVNARTGVDISDYCSNALDPVKLFDELLLLRPRIGLDTSLVNSFQRARDIAWRWLYSRSGPMHTYIWNAYFEDIPNDPDRTNRHQLTPGEMAKYLISNPQQCPAIDRDVPALIAWIASVFKTEGYDAIKEQTWCYEPMGSHTARYGSICAMWYERTGDEKYKAEACRFLNFATYMTLPDGFVAVGPNWPGAWFSDGYSDYVRHFSDAMAAVPEWAPHNENHVLRSSSVVQNIDYKTDRIILRTFDNEGVLRVKLARKPREVIVGSKPLIVVWKPLPGGVVADIVYSGSYNVEIVY